MSKQAVPPPPGDKPSAREAAAAAAARVAALAAAGRHPRRAVPLDLPAGGAHAGQTTLTYSQFLTDVGKRTVKTVTIAQSGGTSTGTLTNKTNYTVVIPPQAGQSLLDTLQANGVQTTGSTSSPGFGTELLNWIIILAPFIILVWFWTAAVPWRGRADAGHPRRRPVPRQGVRRGAAVHHVHRRRRVRRREVRDQRGRRLPAQPRPLLAGPARSCRAACSWSARPEPARPCSPGPWRARRRCRSSRSPAPASWRCSSASARPGSATCSPRRASGRPRSSSSTRSTRSASAGRARARSSPTTSGSRRSTSCWPRWTASTRRWASWSSPRPTGPRSSTPPCCAPAGSTAR